MILLKKTTFLTRVYFYFIDFSIDATLYDGLGMFVNDSPVGNCSMKVVEKNNIPYLCLKSIKFIKKGTELRYNYGATGLWWRGKVNLS